MYLHVLTLGSAQPPTPQLAALSLGQASLPQKQPPLHSANPYASLDILFNLAAFLGLGSQFCVTIAAGALAYLRHNASGGRLHYELFALLDTISCGPEELSASPYESLPPQLLAARCCCQHSEA